MVKEKITKSDFIILYILAGLTFCLVFGLSSPSLTMNDEWITVNQVNQLISGSQLIENEGKYGSAFSGEGSAYFTSRGNYLAYSLFLPIISLPVMQVIVSAGDLFRLFFLILWLILGVSALIVSIWLIKEPNWRNGGYVCWLIMILFFCLFLINIYYYQPFITTFKDSPTESAAVIFTNEILFSLMTPMIYTVFRNLSFDRRTAIVGAISVICCSTYFFWSTSAKDHLLVAFLLTGIFLFFSSLLIHQSPWKWFMLFFFLGLLCWARPEYGIIILAGILLWKILSFVSFKPGSFRLKPEWMQSGLFPSIFGVLLGLLPLFLNNYIITGNPLIPPQYLYLTTTRASITSVSAISNEVQNAALVKIFTYVGQILRFYTPDIQNFPVDLTSLAFSAPNGGVGIFFICPIILPAILYGLLNIKTFKEQYDEKTRQMIYFSIFIAVLTTIAYLRVIHGSTTSEGSLPDMRYFSPIYLPLGIISILLLSPLISNKASAWLKSLLISVLVAAPLVTIGTSFILPHSISPILYSNLYIRILIIILLVIFCLAAWSKKIWKTDIVFPALFALLVMIPQVFNFFYVVMIVFYKVNGYPYWQPLLQYFFTYVVTIIN